MFEITEYNSKVKLEAVRESQVEAARESQVEAARESQVENKRIASAGSIFEMKKPVIDVEAGLQSNFATIYHNDQKGKPYNPENAKITGLDVGEKLLANYERNYMKKFPFEKGQYHQCIPNPDRPNEFITVMLVNRSLKLAKIAESVEAEFNAEQEQGLSKTYEEYDIVVPDEGGHGDVARNMDVRKFGPNNVVICGGIVAAAALEPRGDAGCQVTR